MKVKVTEGALREFLKQQVLLERDPQSDPAFITEPRLEDKTPIKPNPNVGEETDESLPIEDPDWFPDDVAQLATAVKQAAMKLDNSDNIEKTWDKVKELLDAQHDIDENVVESAKLLFQSLLTKVGATPLIEAMDDNDFEWAYDPDIDNYESAFNPDMWEIEPSDGGVSQASQMAPGEAAAEPDEDGDNIDMELPAEEKLMSKMIDFAKGNKAKNKIYHRGLKTGKEVVQDLTDQGWIDPLTDKPLTSVGNTDYVSREKMARLCAMPDEEFTEFHNAAFDEWIDLMSMSTEITDEELDLLIANPDIVQGFYGKNVKDDEGREAWFDEGRGLPSYRRIVDAMLYNLLSTERGQGKKSIVGGGTDDLIGWASMDVHEDPKDATSPVVGQAKRTKTAQKIASRVMAANQIGHGERLADVESMKAMLDDAGITDPARRAMILKQVRMSPAKGGVPEMVPHDFEVGPYGEDVESEWATGVRDPLHPVEGETGTYHPHHWATDEFGNVRVPAHMQRKHGFAKPPKLMSKSTKAPLQKSTVATPVAQAPTAAPRRGIAKAPTTQRAASLASQSSQTGAKSYQQILDKELSRPQPNQFMVDRLRALIAKQNAGE